MQNCIKNTVETEEEKEVEKEAMKVAEKEAENEGVLDVDVFLSTVREERTSRCPLIGYVTFTIS